MAKYKRSISVESKEEFVKTVLERYAEDLQDRADWSEQQLQRTAKLRGWLEAKQFPWPNASNQHIPMLMSNSLRTQDTLHNAVMSSRPVMSAIAVNHADYDKGAKIDELLDYQLFVEQLGEEKIGDLICSFVDNGKFVAFIPWVKDRRETIDTDILDIAVPHDVDPAPFYEQWLSQKFPTAVSVRVGEGRYRLSMEDALYKEQKAKVEFFCDDDGRHFAHTTRELPIFEGPCLIPKQLEDIVVPSRAENLQPPGPSNPNGADHVIMVDYPSVDEIVRLQKAGYYDVLSDDELSSMTERAEAGISEPAGRDANDPDEHKSQRDALAGMTYGNASTVSKTVTRLTYFGRWDLNGDGLEEEIVARILLEEKRLCRLRYLQEEFPTPRPRRPFAEGTMLPVPGQFYGIGMLELLEHLHDLMKTILDQSIDKHTLSNVPWGLYRSASGVRPETIRMQPGALYPVSNPSQDITFPSLPQQDQATAMNFLSMVQQWAERLSMQGSLQFGGVPQGKASALRTSTNMMSILQQGDARPERVLRRFFRGLSEVYQQMHELNQVFLPAKKQYRVTGVPAPGSDPYREIESPSHIKGAFDFDFRANSLNTNKALTSQVLAELMPALVNGMTIQMGLVDQEKIYNLLRDLTKSKGQDEHRYLKMPQSAAQPKVTAEDAMGQITQGILPEGVPSEGAQMHAQLLMQIANDSRFQSLLNEEPAIGIIFRSYLEQVQQQAMKDQAMAQMAQQFAGAFGGGGGTGGPEGSVTPGADQMNLAQGPNQVGDESLPGAKGMMA